MKNKWTIGEVAKLFAISTDSLRYYEKSGLLSSHRHEQNSYRYYGYDDLVILMDILTFRSMELPVKDIRQALCEMDIAAMKNLLQENQQALEQKIKLLSEQSRQLEKLTERYEECQQHLGKFSIVNAPLFKSKFLSLDAEDLIKIIQQYHTPDTSWMNVLRYTMLLPEESLLSAEDFDKALVGLSFEDSTLAGFSAAERAEFKAPPAGTYLYTVLSSDYAADSNKMLASAMLWIKKQGYRAKGDLLARYLASTHKDGLDYYEIWFQIIKA